MKSKFKIAIVQFEIKQFSPEENLKKAEEFVKKASSEADIVVFPEDFITGPILGKLEFADSEKKYCRFFQHLAKKYKIDIVPGSIIEKERTGFYNTTYYIDARGKIRGKYRKINLWHAERYLTPGNEISVFNTKFGKIGLIICWDLMFPEVFRKMVMRGVNTVICPSYWTFQDASLGLKYDKDSEAKLVDALCVARAFENEIIMVYCNAAGSVVFSKNYKAKLLGRSQIAMPFVGAIKKLNHNKEEMFVQEIDTTILKDAERAYRIRKSLKNRVLY